MNRSSFITYKKRIVITTGIATFFFGFGAGALLNAYLLLIHSPFVSQLRSSLTYTSSIVGDGLLLPIVNMVVVSFLISQLNFIRKGTLVKALIGGVLITSYFHINQAINKLTNWAMPTPWHWNGLGLWHAIYMLSVTSLLSLMLIVTLTYTLRKRVLPKEAVIVTAGVVVFLTLLRIDYMSVSIAKAFFLHN